MGKNYLETLHPEIRAYFHLLCPKFPQWLCEYIDTPEMQRLAGTSLNCGTDHCKLFNIRYWYSNLDHSVGVALILWYFTQDKRQTLAGLFHDIATPAFKHCIDFMNGDAEHQESTEERTEQILRDAVLINTLLQRDSIALEDVWDYKKYPIADNETPRLAADRLEYNFSSGLSFYRVWSLEKIQQMYNNITVAANEDGIPELAFRDVIACEAYIHTVSKLWPRWICDADRTAMQFIADICTAMSRSGLLTVDDLYSHSEQQIVENIQSCSIVEIKKAFAAFQNTEKVCCGTELQPGWYRTKAIAKRRYVDPLVTLPGGAQRISVLSAQAARDIANYLAIPAGGYYTGFDFPFEIK